MTEPASAPPPSPETLNLLGTCWRADPAAAAGGAARHQHPGCRAGDAHSRGLLRHADGR